MHFFLPLEKMFWIRPLSYSCLTKKGGITPPFLLKYYSGFVSAINTKANTITHASEASKAVVAPLQSPLERIFAFP
jgi:hypothetical protein